MAPKLFCTVKGCKLMGAQFADKRELDDHIVSLHKGSKAAKEIKERDATQYLTWSHIHPPLSSYSPGGGVHSGYLRVLGADGAIDCLTQPSQTRSHLFSSALPASRPLTRPLCPGQHPAR